MILATIREFLDTAELNMELFQAGSNPLNIAAELEDNTSVRMFVVNTVFNAKTSDTITRGHWFIENKHHHVRDVQLKEDSRRIRKKPEIMMVVRSFGYNIIQANKQSGQFSTQIEYNKLNVNKIFNYKDVIL